MLMSNKSVNLLTINRNTITYELIYTAIKCDVNSCIYREYSSYLSFCSNLIAFPLIVFTSILGIVATMQTIELDDKENYLHTNSTSKIIISILSILVAIMSGLQKYCKYAERTEITKGYAKNFEKLGYSIENFLYEIKNKTNTTQNEIFDKLTSNMFKDFEILITECDDQPCNMTDKQYKLFNEKSKVLLNNPNRSTPNPICCKGLNNCFNFLCNYGDYVYDIEEQEELNDNLINFNNLDLIIQNLKYKHSSNMQLFPVIRYL